MLSILEIAQINLVSQVVLVLLLFSGFMLMKRGRFFLHGTLMLVAVVLNAVSLLLIMGPSLLGLSAGIEGYPLKFSLTVVAHAILGSIAEGLAIWIVTSWRLRSGFKHCAGKRRIMLVTLVLWSMALFLGIVLYVFKYTSSGAVLFGTWSFRVLW